MAACLRYNAEAIDKRSEKRQWMQISRKPIWKIRMPHRKSIDDQKETKFANTAFTMNIDDKTKDWDTENFTEIDLTAQKVYVWRNGKVAF